MRGQERQRGSRSHGLIPATLFLAALALAIPGNLALDASSRQQVADVTLRQEVQELRELVDGGSCELAGAAAEADRVSAGLVRFLLRMSQSLDQLSRDASRFLDWIEDVLGRDGLDALDAVAEGVARWFGQALEDPAACHGASAGAEVPPPSCA